MADGLFFIQRYLGSDDENCSGSESKIKPDKIKYFEEKNKPKKKKRKLSTLENVESDEKVEEESYEFDESKESKVENKIKKILPLKIYDKNCQLNNKHIEIKGISKTKKIESFSSEIVQNGHSTSRDNSISDVNSEEVKLLPISITENSYSEQENKKRKKSNETDGSIHGSIVETHSKDIRKGKSSKKKKKVNPNDSNLDLSTTQKSNENFQPIGQAKDSKSMKIQLALPKWISCPTFVSVDLHKQKTTILDLEYLDDNSKKNLKDAGIEYLFPVQLSVIPWLMDNSRGSLLVRPNDLCVSAPTGSGKTLAFVLPIVQTLKKRVVGAVRALVVLPVSELAMQVHKVFEMFIKGTDLKVAIITGQKSFLNEQQILVKVGIRRTYSLVDIIVTTPDRILDHINRTEGFSLKKLRYLVIDEADRMMDDIQKGWLKHIEEAVYKDDCTSCECFSFNGERIIALQSSACDFQGMHQPLQKLLYSATLSHNPEKLHTLSLYKPKLFAARSRPDEFIGKCPIPEELQIKALVCVDGTKPMVLCQFIQQEGFKKILCFTESVERSQRLYLVLDEMGFLPVREISSNNRPVQRKITLTQFGDGKIKILVCSDLMARGIDIEDIDCVVSYDVPLFAKTYIHRIGRTARAGKKGTALTIMTESEIPKFRKMLNSAGIPVPEQKYVDSESLGEYVESFQRALEAANIRLRKLKNSAKFNKKPQRKYK